MPKKLNHPILLSIEGLLAGCDVERLRRSGPGGQHRNKVETAVRLRHRTSGVSAEASERRSQAENQNVALGRLRVNLALQLRATWPPGREPSELWKSRCRGGRVEVNVSHEDFPVLLAEAMDAIAASDFDLKQPAERLGCTASQLVKLLKKEPRAIQLINGERRARGLHGFH